MSDIQVTEKGHVAQIEIRRPPANYFDRSLISEIVAACDGLQRTGTRAIVLCSEGKHFCAGADFAGGEAATDPSTVSEQLYREAVRLFAVPIPIIAAVQGSAVGGGLGLACAADFRVASPSTRFHANFSMLGFHQGFGLSVSLPRIVGSQVAADLLYSSRRVDGETAHALGLADRLVADGELRAEATRWAEEIAARAPLAVRSMKETLRGPLTAEISAALERELSEQRVLWATNDSKAGIAANLARETPEFSGN